MKTFTKLDNTDNETRTQFKHVVKAGGSVLVVTSNGAESEFPISVFNNISNRLKEAKRELVSESNTVEVVKP